MTTEEVRKVDAAGDRAGDVVLVPLSQIKINEKENVRSYYEEIDELAKAIELQGLLTPLTVDQNHKLIAGFRRARALHQLYAKEPDTLITCKVKEIDAPATAMLLNLGENIRNGIPDYDFAKRLAELESSDGKYGIKRSMLEKQTGKSKTAVGKFITTWNGICAKVRKAWEASTHKELLDVDGKVVEIPTVKVYEWSKEDEKTQHKLLAAFLNGDSDELEPDADEPEGDGGGGEESEPSRAPKKKEIKEYVEKLNVKSEKDGGLDKEDYGRLRALTWVLGDITRRTMMANE